MKTKAEPKVEQSIKVTLEGKTVELTKSEATSLFNDLKKALNIAEPPAWISPVVIERPVYIPRPHYYETTWGSGPRITCQNDQASAGGTYGRVFNLCSSAQ